VKLLERLLGDAGYTNVASTMAPQDVSSLHRENRHDLILLRISANVTGDFGNVTDLGLGAGLRG